MKKLISNTFDRRCNNLRGLLLAISLLSFLSCVPQSKQPITIEVGGDKGNIDMTVNADTIFIKEIDTIFIDKPFEVVVRDTIYQDKIVEVIKEVEVIKTDTILRDYNYSEMKELVNLWAEADTIRAKSAIINLDYTNTGLNPTDKPTIYTFVYGIGIVPVEMDTIYNWQRVFDIERVKTLAKTRYRSLGLPFQLRTHEYYNKTSNSVGVRIFATEQCKISYFINGVKHNASSEAFNAGKVSDIEYRHSRIIDGLEPATSYELRVEVENAKGEKDVSENLWINTL